MSKVKTYPPGFCVTCKSYICCGCKENAEACACPPERWKTPHPLADDDSLFSGIFKMAGTAV